MHREPDSELVYSTDPKLNQKCTKCKKLLPECLCKNESASQHSFTALLRIETAGRQGKTVTIIDRLPRHPHFIEKLERVLKSRCGSGGTHRISGPYGMIEIQGDKRALIRSILTQEGIPFKG